MYWNNLTALLIGIFLYGTPQAASQCDFPSSIFGSWVSQDRGFLQVNQTVLSNYRLKGVGPTSIQLECLQKNESLYLLRGLQGIKIFGVVLDMYLCMNLTTLGTDSFLFHVLTPYNDFTRDFMDLAPNDTTLTMEKVCSLQSQDDPKRLINYYKNASSVGPIDSIVCPSILQQIFRNFSVSSSTCFESQMTITCNDKRRIDVEIPSHCNFTNFTRGQLQLQCVYAEMTGSVTHLFTWSHDVVAPMSAYGFVCMTIQQEDSSNTVTVGFHGEDCNSNPSAIFILNGPRDSCPVTQPSTTEKPSSPGVKRHEDSPNSVAAAIIVIVVVSIVVAIIIMILICYREYLCNLINKSDTEKDASQNNTFTDISRIETKENSSQEDTGL